MKLSLQNQIRFMSRFRSVKPGLTVTHAVCHKLHNPFTLVPANTEKPDFVGFSGFAHVLKVAEPRHLAQIAETVVALIAVYMVNMLRRPFASYISPRKAMRELLSVIDSYSPVARRLRRSGWPPYKIRSLFMLNPCKKPRIGVVMERRAQMFNRAWWVHCHDNGFNMRGAT